MCVDNVRSLENGLAEVYIDITHAGLQGCPQSLVGNDGTAQSCHTFERLPAQSAGDGLLEGMGVLNITCVFKLQGPGHITFTQDGYDGHHHRLTMHV